MIRIAFLLTCGLAFAALSSAAAEIPAGLLKCAEERDDARRLACYDAQIARAGEHRRSDDNSSQARAGAKDRADEAQAAETDAAPSVDSFGMTGDLARKNLPDAPEAITARITSIREKPRGERILHLDNGQVWEELEHNRRLRLETGDTITIEAGTFGSYRIRGSGNRFTKAQRIE